jgi:hypothetical protein
MKSMFRSSKDHQLATKCFFGRDYFFTGGLVTGLVQIEESDIVDICLQAFGCILVETRWSNCNSSYLNELFLDTNDESLNLNNDMEKYVYSSTVKKIHHKDLFFQFNLPENCLPSFRVRKYLFLVDIYFTM